MEILPPWAFVAAGGALGALARGGLDALAAALPWSGPIADFALVAWSTLLVDLGGALFLGVLSALLARRAAPSPGLVRLRLFAATGFAGAFTTYGTLIARTGSAMIAHPDPASILLAVSASLGLLVLGVVAAGLGWASTRAALSRRSKADA